MTEDPTTVVILDDKHNLSSRDPPLALICSGEGIKQSELRGCANGGLVFALLAISLTIGKPFDFVLLGVAGSSYIRAGEAAQST